MMGDTAVNRLARAPHGKPIKYFIQYFIYYVPIQNNSGYTRKLKSKTWLPIASVL